MIILDTDFLIDLTKGKTEAVKKLEGIANEALAIASISLTELYYGAFKQKQHLEEEKFSDYEILAFKRQEACLAARIRVGLEKGAGRIGIVDEMIAATAIAQNARVLT